MPTTRYRHLCNKTQLASWLSRDPKQEKGGKNLYCIVKNDVVNHTDVLGLMTRDKVESEIQGLRAAIRFQHLPCCGKGGGLAKLRTVAISGSTVTVSIDLVKVPKDSSGFVIPIKYYWWNCFRAHNEAYDADDLPTGSATDDQPWKKYGWEAGDQTDTESADGEAEAGQWDNNHWGWFGIAVYMYCHYGFMDVDYSETSQGIYRWVSMPHPDYAPAPTSLGHWAQDEGF
jgi:hypothetical protein